MRIAIVAPSPVPYVIGGVENLLWGLSDTINQKTEDIVEIFKLPGREYDFWNLIETYYAFYQFDISYFDCVIVTKYPAWMIQHENIICYMQHTLRGLYDTYHFTKMPTKVKQGCPSIDRILNYMKKNRTPKNLDVFFEMLFQLKKDNKIPQEYFEFPAPFIRQLVHYMDYWALSRPAIKKYCAISETVKKRKDYFPENIDVQVIHHPSNLKNFTCEQYKHIFMVSRLDGPKRIDLLIQAMKYVKSDIKLWIAGSGPKEQELKKMAEGDKRIQFLGFIHDEEVEKYYANSLVIPYFPYDEDYGLITIEAMMHKKPVITTEDSGGPTEFVRSGETGFLVKADPKEIAKKIDYLFQNPKEARRMGENAHDLVQKITWENTVSKLLEGMRAKNSTARRQFYVPSSLKSGNLKKITITSTFSVYPPEGGGQVRIFELYRNLASDYEIEIIAFTNVDKKKEDGKIAKHLREVKIPKSLKHQQREQEIESKIGIPITDIGMITLSGFTPEYGAYLKESVENSDLVIISHPYLYYEARKYLGNKKFVYEAHNVESIMKEEMLPKNEYAKRLVREVFQIEKECCEESEFIVTCSYEDQLTFHQIYGVPMEKMITIPNGVDCKKTSFTPVDERIEKKRCAGLENETLGLFVGSWHGPNLEAAEEIFRIAKKCPNIKFLLMGSQCRYFAKKKLPLNVGMLGVVSEQEKSRIFSMVDFALNPMLSGSGTNLKMFDYMAAGIPIITTRFGTRGIEEKNCFILSEIEDMPDVIQQFQLEQEMEQIEYARNYVQQNFDWSAIAKILHEKIQTIL